jgi:AGZA family xanthine/uracil permease-like MFS transporter
MKYFCKGDIDGFFGLALDNLIQILLIISLCTYLLGLPTDIIYLKILPGIAVSLIIGNLFYAWQAVELGKREKRADVCSLPYGINTPSVFVYVFMVMLPVKYAASNNPNIAAEDVATLVWQAGVVACLGSGLIELAGAFVAEKIRKATPRAALLSTLSGIALGFISLPFLYRTFAHPIVGFTTLAIIFAVYFGRVKFKFNIPGGLVAVVVGTALCWFTGLAPGPEPAVKGIALNIPIPVIGDIISAFQSGYFTDFFNIIIPMGVFNVLGSLQNIESAEAAGDKFKTAPSLAVNGAGSMVAALFGSCFPTTIYIGHPGWKGLGARAGYSILNAIFISIICITGTVSYIVYAVPIEAGMAIVLWIGIVITAQAFQATDKRHAPAAAVGVIIGVGAWGAVMIKNGLRVGDELYKSATKDNINWAEQSETITSLFMNADTNITGAFALEQGCIFTAMTFAAIVAYVIDRRFFMAAIWAAVCALLAATGLIHSFKWDYIDATLSLTPATKWIWAYLIMAVFFLICPFVTEKADKKSGKSS